MAYRVNPTENTMLKITKTIPTEVTLGMPNVTESFDGVPEDDDCLLNDDFGCDGRCDECIFQYDNYRALRSQSEPEDEQIEPDEAPDVPNTMSFGDAVESVYEECASQGFIPTVNLMDIIESLERPECQHFDPDNLYCTQCGFPTSCPEFTKTGDCPY